MKKIKYIIIWKDDTKSIVITNGDKDKSKIFMQAERIENGLEYHIKSMKKLKPLK